MSSRGFSQSLMKSWQALVFMGLNNFLHPRLHFLGYDFAMFYPPEKFNQCLINDPRTDEVGEPT